MMSEPLPTLLTTEEVAKALRVDPRSVRRWAQEGKLPSVKLAGTVLRFRAVDVKQWVEGFAR